MQLIKCELGHIYDAEKFRSCPHCYGVGMTKDDEADALGMLQADKTTEQSETVEQKQYYVMHRRRVQGILVCVEGRMKGAAFELREGENVIGRSSNMDVALNLEESISRQAHASIECDPDDQRFVLKFEETRRDVWVNGHTVEPGSLIVDRDVIRLGDCELVLVDVGDVWKGRNR